MGRSFLWFLNHLLTLMILQSWYPFTPLSIFSSKSCSCHSDVKTATTTPPFTFSLKFLSFTPWLNATDRNNNNVNKDDKKQIPPTYTENDEKKQMIVIPDEISSNNNELYELYFNEPTFGPLFHVPCINSNDNKSYEPFFKFNIYSIRIYF